MTLLTRGAVAFPGTSRAYLTGGWRDERPVHVHRPAPCHNACPAGEDAQAYVALVQEGRLFEAWRTIVAVNPLPAITGRVCHHPCETACNRQHLDAPIAIHSIERTLGDEAIREGWRLDMPEMHADAPKVAVIGAGPSGLSAAYHLRRQGFRVTIYDQAPEAGGMLRSAIPAYRLPRDVLDAEIARLLATGIAFQGETRLGRDMQLFDLRRDFAAVYLAPGCQRMRDWAVDGSETVDAPSGLDLLLEWLNLGTTPAKGKRVVVHGGGNTAIDVARILRWSGAKEVHVVAASNLPGQSEDASDEAMAAFPREITQAQEEGVIIHPHHTLTRLVSVDGRLRAAEITAVRKVAAGDRTRRVAFEGTETMIAADLVVPAIGEVVDATGFEMLLGRKSYIPADARGAVSDAPGVFAGGDALGSRGTVSAAIGDGRRAAEAIGRFVRGEAEPARATIDPIAVKELNLDYFEPARRRDGMVTPPAERSPDAEIEASLDMAELIGEAARCLSCGNCMACDNCWTFCPEPAVLKTQMLAADGSHYVFDYDFCKGCGVCARECPSGFIAMIDEARSPAAP